MLNMLKSSLPARAGLAVILIAVLALSSAISAGLLAWISEDDAAAINTAGSLRMATYRLDWQLEAKAPASEIKRLADDLEQRLNSTKLNHFLSGGPQDPAQNAFNAVLALWHGELRPALDQGRASDFQAQTDAFVSKIETFVLRLQQQSEQRQGLQQTIQGAALLITVIILTIVMYELQNGVIIPLQELVSTTERFRAGDLNARIEHRSSDELGQMADSFNAMADVIEESQHTLESRVAQKTQSLEQSNSALELLYQSSRRIASNPASAEQLDQLIDSFQQRLPGLRLTLCLNGNAQDNSEQLIALHGSESREICARSDCNTCERKLQPRLHTYPVSTQGLNHGELRAHYLDGHTPAPWESELIEAQANLVGTALSLERQRQKDNRLLLLDERTIIARELHDSLAQALSYMKLQVSRLQTLIRRGQPAEQLELVSEELREGLNNAYRQLRELLTTFRLQIHDGGLEQALDETVREFAERGALHVLLQCETPAAELSASEQIHLLQIAREALSNCARHAQAEHAWVLLQQQGEHICLRIEDDGCGMTGTVDSRQHHGLNIMQERASSLHGELHISRREPQGTRIELNFRLEFLSQPAHKEQA